MITVGPQIFSLQLIATSRDYLGGLEDATGRSLTLVAQKFMLQPIRAIALGYQPP
jgi:hypothetical protein